MAATQPDSRVMGIREFVFSRQGDVSGTIHQTEAGNSFTHSVFRIKSNIHEGLQKKLHILDLITDKRNATSIKKR